MYEEILVQRDLKTPIKNSRSHLESRLKYSLKYFKSWKRIRKAEGPYLLMPSISVWLRTQCHVCMLVCPLARALKNFTFSNGILAAVLVALGSMTQCNLFEYFSIDQTEGRCGESLNTLTYFRLVSASWVLHVDIPDSGVMQSFQSSCQAEQIHKILLLFISCALIVLPCLHSIDRCMITNSIITQGQTTLLVPVKVTRSVLAGCHHRGLRTLP